MVGNMIKPNDAGGGGSQVTKLTISIPKTSITYNTGLSKYQARIDISASSNSQVYNALKSAAYAQMTVSAYDWNSTYKSLILYDMFISTDILQAGSLSPYVGNRQYSYNAKMADTYIDEVSIAYNWQENKYILDIREVQAAYDSMPSAANIQVDFYIFS